MKKLNLLLIVFIISCGRPKSTDQEKSEIKQRQRLEALTTAYDTVAGTYSGVMYLVEDNSKYLVELNIRVVQDEDPVTGLALDAKLNGSLKVFERILSDDNFIVSYGITGGSYDQDTQKISLELNDKLTLKGDATGEMVDAVLLSTIKGDVAELELERVE
ncbi:MAG: hypothetical protein CME62_12235 [Halobacteriovoraceae bacterium]|nr:hypothetical protein [Halobacteriovoraceae bacterium]|tara:strand:- start:4759 stop:5238 length:480 start_codon:yes stop_codon:yes gene_type:complete